MKKYIEVNKKVFSKLNDIYGDKIPDNILERVNNELDWLIENNKSKLLLSLISFKGLLKNELKDNYVIVGNINNWYIAYLLDLIIINPIDYNDFSCDIDAEIYLPENTMDYVISKFNDKYNGVIKAVSTNDREDFPFYHLITFDYDNLLPTYEKSKIRPTMPLRTKSKRSEIESKFDIIRIHEIPVLELLKQINKLNIEFPEFNEENYLQLKKSIDMHHTKHITKFEEIMSKYNSFNEMIFNNLKLIEKIQKEFYVTYLKYNYPLTYYNASFKYLNNHINKNLDIKAIKKYMNDFESALKYYEAKEEFKGEDYYPNAFFRLCYDVKNTCDKNFKIDINDNNEIVPIFYNMVFLESIPLNGKKELLSKILLNFIENRSNKIVNLYTTEGTINWYLANIISSDINENKEVVETYLNPLKESRYILDNRPLDEIDTNKFLNSINKLRNSCIFLYSLKENIIDNLDFLLETSGASNIIIIDNLKSFLLNTKYSIGEVLSKLNNLNKEIYIFDNLKDGKVTNLKYKRYHTRYIYTINKINDMIKIESVTSFKDMYIIEGGK